MRKAIIETKRATIAAGAAILTAALAACSSGGSSPQPVTTVNPINGKLQLAVGTANIFGDLGAGNGSATGLNVVATFRQVAGQQTVGASETLVNTPTLSGPMTLPAGVGTPDDYGATVLTGPTAAEIANATISATGQPPAGTYPVAASSFGVSNGVFASGIEPFNTTVVGGPGQLPAGQTISYAPNAQPLYDPLVASGAGDPNGFVPFGGPPAFDPNKDGRGTRDGQGEPSDQLGVEEGLDVFQGVVPRTGSYALKVVIPTAAQDLTVSANATLASTATLPSFFAPTTVTADGNGGLSAIPVTLPAGVTEAYVQITDFGPTQSTAANAVNPVSCNGSETTNAFYTLRVTASGSYALADGIGPVGTTSATNPTLCTAAQNTAYSIANVTGFTGQSDGDQFTVQFVGFDYPAYAASPIAELGNPSPTLTGANGQADITISSATPFTQPAGTTGVQTLSARRSALSRMRGLAHLRGASRMNRRR